MKFAVVSDVHVNQHPDWTRLVFERMAARGDLDFVAFLGDIDDSTCDSWERLFSPLRDLVRCPVYACRGNHDDPARWRGYWGLPDDYTKVFPGVRCVFLDSDAWKHDGPKTAWLSAALPGPEPHKFFFTHLAPRVPPWDYGMGPNRTRALLELCRREKVTACFFGHMHMFGAQRWGETWLLVASGGGGEYHGQPYAMHHSNFYLLAETEPGFRFTLCQQHKDREEAHPMEQVVASLGKANAF